MQFTFNNVTQSRGTKAAFSGLVVLTAGVCGYAVSTVRLGPALIGIGLVAGAAFFLARPETAVALFLLVGMLKADPRISSTFAFDLTIVLAAVLALSCFLKLSRRTGSRPPVPRPYPLYVLLVVMMLTSLFYTPNVGAGADKCARFVFLTGLAVVSPHILFDSVRKLRVFLYALAGFGFLFSLDALTRLGGRERLTTLGGLTIQLGTAAGITLAIFWTMLLPRFPLRHRVLMLPLLAVPLLALIGSGARGPVVGAICVLLFGVVVHRFLLADAVILAAVGCAGLALVGIPQASYEYLSTLLGARSIAVMGFRNDLMSLAWQLIQEHPFLGVGIGGYPYYSPNPQIYGWPHNIFLELGAELGIMAALIFAALVACSFKEAVAQIRDRQFPLLNLSFAVLSLMIFGFLQMIKSGDINDNRSMWLYLGLPFLLRSLSRNYSEEVSLPARGDSSQ